MPFTIHKNNRAITEILARELGAGVLREHLVLVATPNDKRLLQAELAKIGAGLVPKVEVLAHQLATWLKFGVEVEPGSIFLTPRERRFAMDRWNQTFARGIVEAQLDYMHEVISWLYLHGEVPASLPESFGSIGDDIRHFTSWCHDQGWIDRSSLFFWADRVPAQAIDHRHIHLFLLGKLQRHHALAIDAIMDNGGSACNWHLYRPIGGGLGTGLRSDNGIDDSDANRELVVATSITGTHPRDEVAKVFGSIKKQVADADEPIGFGDFVILLSSYKTYRPVVEHMSHRFGVEVSFTEGASVLGDPAVSRLRSWLYLGVNGFALDDVLDVFGDGVVPLAGNVNGETISPNLRTFSQFCKKFNIRTVEQLQNDLERAIEREVRNRNDAIRRKGGDPEQEPSDFKERHGEYYRAILSGLKELETGYLSGVHPISEWYQWVVDRTKQLGTLKSAEIMAGLARISRAAETGLSMVARIGFDPLIDGRGFMDAFDALLDGSLPVSQHPGRVFVGLVDDMTCLIGKTVFVLGMSDANFPATSRSDDLFSHLDEGLLGWVRSRENSPLESATCWLASVARYSDSLYLCHSSDEASHQVMPSVFLTDPQIFLPWLSIKPLQDELVEQCLDTFDWLIHHRSIPWSPETDIVEVLDLASLSRHVSAVTRLRESPDRITMWDGVLTDVKPEWSDVAKEVLNKALMHLKTDDQLKLSVSQLDSFAQSPLEYFFHRLLKLEPPTEYVDEAEMNRKGTLLHLILDLFYSDAVRYGDLIDPKRDPAAAFKRIASIAEDVFAEHPEDLGNPDTPFPAMLKRQILRTLEAFVQVEHDGLKQLADNVKAGVRPATLRGRDTTITEVPFEYRLDVDGEQVAVHGFIDRIDTNDDGSIQVIYDYKTGGDTSIKVFDEMNSGLSFQLPVYLNARKADGGSILAGYYHIQLSTAGKDIQLRGMLGDQLLTSVKPSGLNYKNNKGLLANDVLRQFLDLLQENRIKPIVRLIRSGRFHQSLTAPSEYSDYSRISRWSESVNELRKLALGRGAGDATSMLEHYYVSIPIIGGIDGASETSGED